MKKISTLFAGFFFAFLFCCNGFAQPTVSWVTRYNGPDNKIDNARKMALDVQGNVYVTGTSATKNGSTYITTVKYNAQGVQQWVAQYTGTIKGDNYPYAFTVDAVGNVYVTGRSMGNNSTYDIATVKYNSAGLQQWAARYNGTSNLNDVPGDIKADALGNVYVTGFTDGQFMNNGDAIITLKYNASGNQQWTAKYDQLPNGTGTNNEQGNSLAVDGNGNIYITGKSGGMVIIKYDSTSGNSIWIRNIANADGRTILIDGGNNAIVSGFSPKIVKYDTNGSLLWQTTASNSSAAFWDMTLDAAGNIYVTGECSGSNGHSDYVTGKFSSGGTQQWLWPFNGSLNDLDFARSIALDDLGNIYVTGRCSVNNGTRTGGVNYATVKYNNAGVQQWVQLYDSPDKSGSDAFDVVTDAANNVYVTGASAAKSTSYDYATIKYTQGSSLNSTAAVLINKPSVNFSLRNYPNPFHETTTIEYQLPKDGKIKLTVYDLSGNKIATLTDETQTAGTHKINFKAGKLLPGSYYYRIESGEYSEMKKLIVVK
jgi:hypothetical protein